MADVELIEKMLHIIIELDKMMRNDEPMDVTILPLDELSFIKKEESNLMRKILNLQKILERMKKDENPNYFNETVQEFNKLKRHSVKRQIKKNMNYDDSDKELWNRAIYLMRCGESEIVDDEPTMAVLRRVFLRHNVLKNEGNKNFYEAKKIFDMMIRDENVTNCRKYFLSVLLGNSLLFEATCPYSFDWTDIIWIRCHEWLLRQEEILAQQFRNSNTSMEMMKIRSENEENQRETVKCIFSKGNEETNFISLFIIGEIDLLMEKIYASSHIERLSTLLKILPKYKQMTSKQLTDIRCKMALNNEMKMFDLFDQLIDKNNFSLKFYGNAVRDDWKSFFLQLSQQPLQNQLYYCYIITVLLNDADERMMEYFLNYLIHNQELLLQFFYHIITSLYSKSTDSYIRERKLILMFDHLLTTKPKVNQEEFDDLITAVLFFIKCPTFDEEYLGKLIDFIKNLKNQNPVREFTHEKYVKWLSIIMELQTTMNDPENYCRLIDQFYRHYNSHTVSEQMIDREFFQHKNFINFLTIDDELKNNLFIVHKESRFLFDFTMDQSFVNYQLNPLSSWWTSECCFFPNSNFQSNKIFDIIYNKHLVDINEIQELNIHNPYFFEAVRQILKFQTKVNPFNINKLSKLKKVLEQQFKNDKISSLSISTDS
ncbi:hypothetical protein SNEBB_008934 [Seison nebaliae]|nr:hypothetical protein SNEBB_008934 [Seison nebaliae]